MQLIKLENIMDTQEKNQDYFNDSSGLPDEEVIKNFDSSGYRGFKQIKSYSKDPVVEVVVKNNKGHTFTASGETREEAIESIIDQIDQYLDEK